MIMMTMKKRVLRDDDDVDDEDIYQKRDDHQSTQEMSNEKEKDKIIDLVEVGDRDTISTYDQKDQILRTQQELDIQVDEEERALLESKHENLDETLTIESRKEDKVNIVDNTVDDLEELEDEAIQKEHSDDGFSEEKEKIEASSDQQVQNIVSQSSNESNNINLNSNEMKAHDTTGSIDSEKVTEKKQLILPELFNPEPKEPLPANAASQGYMKMADAYLQKGNFKSASKQFLKVLKKSPGHIPAILGYATSMERHVKPKQLVDVARAYANVTIIALEQQNINLATATFHRSLAVCKSIEGDRIETLKFLSSISFNEEIAAEIQYEVGMELIERGTSIDEALLAFEISNGYASQIQSEFYGSSLFQIAKITCNVLGELNEAGNLVKIALESDLKNDFKVDALVLSGKIKENLLDINGAIEDYEKAIELPKTDATGNAYYSLGIALRSQNRDSMTIQSHIEMALNLGMDPTPEAIEILGEDHIAVIKSVHRTEWKQYQESLANDSSDSDSGRGGGIMSSSGVSNDSIFSKNSGMDESDQNNDALSMLEQGAASFDGSVPMGGEAADGFESSISSQESSSRSKVNGKKNFNV